MNTQEELILKTLNELNIPYERITHPPIFTVSEAKLYGGFEADGCKNLFLYDKRSDKHYLVVMLEDKKAHPNTNTVTLVISYSDFEKFLNWSGNDFRFICISKQ